MDGFRYIIGSVKTPDDGVRSLRRIEIGCYLFAALAFACGISKVQFIGLANALALPILFVVAGYYLPRRASRVYGFALSVYAFSIGLLTLQMLGTLHWTGVVLTLLPVWLGIRTPYVTIRYHRLIGSKIIWENAVVVGATAVALFVGSLFVVGTMVTAMGLSSNQASMLLLLSWLVIAFECFVIMTLRRPLVSRPQDDAKKAAAVRVVSQHPKISKRRQAIAALQVQNESGLTRDPLAEIRLAIEEALIARRVTIPPANDGQMTPMVMAGTKKLQDEGAKDKPETVD